MPYKITGRERIPDPMLVNVHSQFANCIFQLFQQVRPTRIIETGTFLGLGTTAAIAASLRELKIDAEFYTIEVNPQHHAIAVQNARQLGVKVHLGLGLSVPRALLPTREEIQQQTIEQQVDGVFVDHEPGARVEQYFAETNFPVRDDLLGKCLRRFDYQPHFLLLDSAGHMGYVEFQYVLPQLRGRCFFALDDTNHVKHYRTVQQIKQDARFKILIESPEKFGFCFAEFNP